jgi:hypothetical protein
MTNLKYRVYLMESERGWGQERWTEDYDTYEEALQRIQSVNAENTSSVAPDWYMQAEEKIEAVEVK